MTISERTLAILRHLAGRPGHDEVKSDFRALLIEEFGVAIDDVQFETRIELKSRTDALVGRTVFEAKKNLDRELKDVEAKLPDYLANREAAEKERFVGIASDGLRWIAYELRDGVLAKLSDHELSPENADRFIAWLDGAVALKASLAPDPLTVQIELGQDSVAYQRAGASLRHIWETLKASPAVALKKQLWANLLKLVYGKDVENEDLFFQHTFLVIVAKAIALAVLEIHEDEPARILNGKAFSDIGIEGAAESDFFDWVLAAPEGVDLVGRIVRHVRRFRLREVQCDVLKVLYESLIDRSERHGLGEYYTPDWLAAKVVRQVVDRPLEQRVLDPACGSGAFLFHAVRAVISAADEFGEAPSRVCSIATSHVMGTDIHPVAVIIARVTYLLALAPALRDREGTISIPVYLGDSMQLSISEFMTGKELTIRVPPPPAGESKSGEPDGRGGEQLDFPETYCRDPGLFDKAIEVMRSGSEAGKSREQVEHEIGRKTEQHYKADLTREQKIAIKDLGKTYVTFDRLRREGRDSVWAYVARNLSRPLFLSAAGGWAHVLVGNPPWVAYRHMSADLQKRFKALAKGERVFVGGKFATQNDLCALFTVRAASLYLRASGRLGFVLPLAAMTRGQYEKFQSGMFETVKLGWEAAWTMDENVQPLFPVPACAVFARRQRMGARMKDKVRAYSGLLPMRDAPEAIADAKLTVTENADPPTKGVFTGGSSYRKDFLNGATLFPRMLCFVERKEVSRILGQNPQAPLVISRRSAQEKQPWKSLPGLESPVEKEFLKPVLLGESILPYRVFRPFEGVIPVNGDNKLLDARAALNRAHNGLARWMKAAEAAWSTNTENTSGAKGEAMSLVQQWDYYGKLMSQFPLAPVRVVYAKAGTQPAACVVRGGQHVIDHKLYWSTVTSEMEAGFLVAILNSETARSRVAALQSKGQWGARDFDKVMFTLPIPRYDHKIKLHHELARAAKAAEDLAASVALPDGVTFVKARQLVRRALADAGLSQKIDALVAKLLDGG